MPINQTHGLSKTTPLYKVWCGVMDRCYKPNHVGFDRYGGRGIVVCERWQDVRNFVADNEPLYAPGLTIERIDNDGNYEPGNCCWATYGEQSNNKSSNRYLTLNGRSMTVAQWARELSIDRKTLTDRIDKFGWTPEAALTTPHRPRGWNKKSG